MAERAFELELACICLDVTQHQLDEWSNEFPNLLGFALAVNLKLVSVFLLLAGSEAESVGIICS
jgi:hypothetical protein